MADHLVLMDVESCSLKALPIAMPYKPYSLGASFLNGEFYIFGGNVEFHAVRWAFKLKKNWEWERLPDMNEKHGSIDSSSVVFDGCIWVMGGHQYGRDLETVEAYDPKSNSWITKPSMSRGRSGTAAAVIKGKIFVCGGAGGPRTAAGRYQSDVEFYDPQLARWIPSTPLPDPRVHLAALVRGSLLIVLGGDTGDHERKRDVWSMDVEEDNPQWIMMKPMKTARSGASAMIYGGKLVVAGGDAWSCMEIFDGKTWSQGPRGVKGFYPATAISEELAQRLLKEHSH